MEIRTANSTDLQVAQWLESWYRPTPEEIAAGQCIVAAEGDEIIGVLRFDHSFFDKPFVKTVFVREGARRRGAAIALLREIERREASRKLFVSTGLTNHGMQAVLHKLGFKMTGFIDNLGPEPELFYFKLCPPGAKV